MTRTTTIARLLLAVVSFLWLGGGPAAAREYKVIDIIGDSITIGGNPDYFTIGKTYGWVEMLLGEGGGDFPPPKDKTLFTLWPGITVHNESYQGAWLSHYGDSGSTRTQQVVDHHPDLVFIQIGEIDLAVAYMDFENTGDHTFSEREREDFRRYLRTLIERLQAGSPRPDIVFLNYFDVFDGLSAKLPDTNFEHYRSIWNIEGNEMLAPIARDAGITVVNLYDVFMHHTYGNDAFFADPLAMPPIYVAMPINTRFDTHPVTAGHSAIYDAVYRQLEAMKYPPASVPSEVWSLY